MTNTTKRYRLLKSLGSGSKIGMCYFKENSDDEYYWREDWNTRCDSVIVENSPLIFEEIKEEQPKEWEIVEGKSLKYGVHKWVDKPTSFIMQSCPDLKCDIHSVKRLSDGEVFSVGDEVEYRSAENFAWDASKVWGGKILNIKIGGYDKEQLEFEIDDNHEWNDSNYPHKYIRNIRHKKPQPKEEFKWTDELKKELWDALPYYDVESWSEIIKQFKQSKSQPQEQSVRPPLGLKPESIHNRHRLNDINDAVERYKAAGKEIPNEWNVEKMFLEAKLEISKLTKEKIQEVEQSKRIEAEVSAAHNPYPDKLHWVAHIYSNAPSYQVTTAAIKQAIEQVLNGDGDQELIEIRRLHATEESFAEIVDLLYSFGLNDYYISAPYRPIDKILSFLKFRLSVDKSAKKNNL